MAWYLLNTALMATAFETGLEELVHDGLRCLVIDETAGHDQHVGIVVLTTEMGYLWNPSQSCTHSLVLVERDGDTFTTTTDSNAGIDLAALYTFGQRMTEIGIVATHVAVGAVILVGIAVALKILNNKLLECIASVVAGYADSLDIHHNE